MKILGIDPGVAIMGYGLIELKAKKIELIKAGCITTSAKFLHAQRLSQIAQEFKKILQKYKPDILSIEELFFYKNAKTAFKVGEARGVILAKAIDAKMPIYEYTPLQVKQAITSYGRADKNQIQQMVKLILKQKQIIEPDDAADAVAIAITCAHSEKLN